MSRLSFEINKLRIGSIWGSYLAFASSSTISPNFGFSEKHLAANRAIRHDFGAICKLRLLECPRSASRPAWALQAPHREITRNDISELILIQIVFLLKCRPKKQFSNQQTSINQHLFTPNLNQHNSPTISGIQDASGFSSLWGSPNKSTHRSLTFVSRYIGIHAEGSNQTPNVFGQLLQVLRYIPGRV